MADQPSLLTEDDIPFARQVTDVPVAAELSESFLSYAMSVITARAIPDARDGLKPVQRRILWSMLQMGVRPGGAYRKSARIVGDTMGRYHPHGDAAIYDTLVRMGQDFSRMVPLVDPQGNFGSLDDPPAAARYTECRLSEAAMDMVGELDEDTVDFRPSYDGEGTEPAVLPAALPNLLVNGTAGIAVGMATSMAPHNLAQVARAIELVMTKRRPRPTTEELMEAIGGPDFPTGGIVVDDGLAEAYATGRGSVRIRALAHVEQVTRARQAIVVTELPYLVGTERAVAKIKEAAAAGRPAGITGVTDLSDRGGLRLQIDVRAGANPHQVLAELYRLTPLEETFAVNNVVLVDGVPTTAGLYDLCRHYIEHRLEVVVRRTRHRLGKARDRLHILEGLIIAVDNIDEVVAIIRASRRPADARVALMERFALTEIQANHVLDMALRRLTALERLGLAEEADKLRADIAEYEKILASEQRQRSLVLAELRRVVKAHGAPRRSQIMAAADIAAPEPAAEGPSAAADGSAADEPCVVTLSTSGNLGRMPVAGARLASPGRHDLIEARLMSSTAAAVAAVTSQGRALMLPVAELPDGTRRARGDNAARLLGANRGERVLALVGPSAERLVIVTAAGAVKRLDPDEVLATKPGLPVVSLADGDYVAAAFMAPDGADVVMVAGDAQALRIPAAAVPVKGRGAAATTGIKLRASTAVAGAGPALGDGLVVVVTSDSRIKATPLAELPARGRGGQGVRIAKLAAREKVTIAAVGDGTGLLAQMAADDDPRKLDPHPVPLTVEPTGRGLVPARTERQILVLAPSRW